MREHGTYAKYVVERCKCEPCRAANRVYERRRVRAIDRPDEVWMPYVPAGQSRAHIAELAAAGVGLKQVARVTGISHGGLSKLVFGTKSRPPSKRIRRETRDKILAVRPDGAAAGAKVDATRTWQLIDAMLAAGKSKAWIARQVVSPTAISLQFSRRMVLKGHADAIERLAAEVLGARAPKPWSRQDVDELNALYGALADALEGRQTPWRARAACRAPGVPTEAFFVPRGATPAAGKAICARCPAQAECLAAHLSEREGVWGGTTPNDRRELRREPTAEAVA